VSSQLGYLQEALQSGEGPTKETISTFFYDLPTTGRRRNKVIIPTPDNELRAHSVLDVFDGDAMVLAKQFIYPVDAKRATPLSVWVVGDLDSKEGHALLEGALRNVDRAGSATRVSFVHVPDEASKNVPGPRLSTLLFQLTAKNEHSSVNAEGLLDMMEEVARIRTNLVDVGEVHANADPDAPLNTFMPEGWSSPDTALAAEFWGAIGPQVADKLGLKGLGLLVNGRVLPAQHFTADDFVALEAYELAKRVQPVANLLKTYFGDDMPRWV
jgi:UDP-glucose:glycoprotein glucosyltransferase